MSYKIPKLLLDIDLYGNRTVCIHFHRNMYRKSLFSIHVGKDVYRNTHDKINLDTQGDDYIKTAVIATA
ncbi:MAG: hypothetical protein LBQ64_04755 [Bacteroidales bacterium]|jgi:hypothetical protein|nr:hypothetical protein [Bacteroidales bacterium]